MSVIYKEKRGNIYCLHPDKKFAEILDIQSISTNSDMDIHILYPFSLVPFGVSASIIDSTSNMLNPVVACCTSIHAYTRKLDKFFTDLKIYVNINGSIYEYRISSNEFRKLDYSQNNVFMCHTISSYKLDVDIHTNDDHWISVLKACRKALVNNHADIVNNYSYGEEILTLIFFVELLKNNRVITYDDIANTVYNLNILLG